jgi:hypothetical protein
MGTHSLLVSWSISCSISLATVLRSFIAHHQDLIVFDYLGHNALADHVLYDELFSLCETLHGLSVLHAAQQ